MTDTTVLIVMVLAGSVGFLAGWCAYGLFGINGGGK